MTETETASTPPTFPAAAARGAGDPHPWTDAPSPSAPSVEDDSRPDRLARWTVAGLLAATAALYIWGLNASGWANSFYSAAAQAGAENWTAWFFGSLDGGNSITVDKPPAAIWLMALSVRIFGLSSWSILVPEALLGVASVGVLYATVRQTLRTWGGAGSTHGLSPRQSHWAALAGAAVFAATPAAVLMFRFNNPDALLVFTMVLASFFTVRATEKASRGWLALAGVAIGLGFLTKMLQAFLVLPALVVAYAMAAPASVKKKIVDLFVAFATMVVSFGWYIAVVELTPASLRPYIGGSQTNSILELIVSYNGLGRITGNQVGSVGGGGNSGSWGEIGLTRLFDGVSGGMISWLIPAALVLSIAALVLLLRRQPATVPGTQTPRQSLAGGITVWLGWLVVTGLTFSLMEGIYHDYYTVALAPAIGGAVALGTAALWANRGLPAARAVLAATSLGTGAWALSLTSEAGGVYQALGWVALVLGLLAAAGLLFANRLPRAIATVLLGAGFTAGMVGPVAYSLDTASTAHTGSIVTAGPVTSGRGGGAGGRGQGQPGQGPNQQAGNGRPDGNGGSGGSAQPGDGNRPGSGSSRQGNTQSGDDSQQGNGGRNRGGGGTGGLLNGSTVSEEMADLLTADAGSYTWVAATIGAQNAASYQLATELPVMALGGFNGTDPSPTLEQFQEYVTEGRIHYFIAGGIGGRANGGSQAASEIASWVQENFTAQTVGTSTVYDLSGS